jgi:hypothetical protein
LQRVPSHRVVDTVDSRIYVRGVRRNIDCRGCRTSRHRS